MDNSTRISLRQATHTPDATAAPHLCPILTLIQSHQLEALLFPATDYAFGTNTTAGATPPPQAPRCNKGNNVARGASSDVAAVNVHKTPVLLPIHPSPVPTFTLL
eukprot:TRINITY_DN9740_c0_g1_i1.p2 TRINITY_DN9740_c0_g1~~TRINITY_DN9740_c0_g1_i1.p2  ORF type:complete len:105 (+),score=23.37 TRINITY_DN9740_c0_g1_i1:228-542(+)